MLHEVRTHALAIASATAPAIQDKGQYHGQKALIKATFFSIDPYDPRPGTRGFRDQRSWDGFTKRGKVEGEQ